MKHNEEVVYLRRRTGEGRTTVSPTAAAVMAGGDSHLCCC
jgi:hypothetical protein